MELTVLGSSSKGNCYVLQNGNEALVIEAGVSLAEVKKAVDFNINKIVGVLVSHEHGDHAKFVNDFLNARLTVSMSEGTWYALSLNSNYKPFFCEFAETFWAGGFQITPFDVIHDAAEPMGFKIWHKETGHVLFVTDTRFMFYKFEGLNNILIECNYRQDILDLNIKNGKVPAALRDRTIMSHMSYDTCLEALQSNDLSHVNNIVLIHLSDGNSNAEEFQRDIAAATGKRVHIAEKGLKINFKKTRF